jgi:uncharacterized protein
MNTLARLILSVVLLGLAGCGGEQPPVAAPSAPAAAGPLKPSEPFGVTTVTLRSPDRGVQLAVPVYDAFEPKLRQRGLMGRRKLPRNAGMVFRFPGGHRGGFWMKNTLIPLSIAFFDRSGTVVAVLDMPPCKQQSCPSYDPEVAYRGALEVNKGFFDRVGLKKGWQIQLPFGLPPPS